jgi:hypothetical protein
LADSSGSLMSGRRNEQRRGSFGKSASEVNSNEKLLTEATRRSDRPLEFLSLNAFQHSRRRTV